MTVTASLPRASSFGPWTSGFSLLTIYLRISSRFSSLWYDTPDSKWTNWVKFFKLIRETTTVSTFLLSCKPHVLAMVAHSLHISIVYTSLTRSLGQELFTYSFLVKFQAHVWFSIKSSSAYKWGVLFLEGASAENFQSQLFPMPCSIALTSSENHWQKAEFKAG